MTHTSHEQNLARMTITGSADDSGRITGTRKPRVMLVGHSLNDTVFGAERSLLDTLAAIDQRAFDVSCVFPKYNSSYLNIVARYTNNITVFPYQWWSNKQKVNQETVARFEDIFRRSAVDLVHVNTITLMDPLVAARNLGIPSIVHARELIDQDIELMRLFGNDPRSIVSDIRSAADFIIANSDATHRLYGTEDRSFRLYNSVDIDRFDLRNDVRPGQLKVGLLSSNSAKKGIVQFFELASLASRSRPELEFVAIGPSNDLTNMLRQALQDREPQPNLRFQDYIADAREAISLVNVVVSLSIVSESFGRTIVEAMAARRPVIAYARGATPELVRHRIDGFLIPPRDLGLALKHITYLADNPHAVAKMGQNGRRRAKKLFSPRQFAAQLNAIYRQILNARMQTRPCQ
jgi:glycosyltransferase involved in cell wall biosynthesis